VVKALRPGAPHCVSTQLQRWLLATSPSHGVTIDAATRDHIYVLVKLCLTAAAAEAECSLEQHALNGQSGEVRVDPRALTFECPRLADGVSWLAAQLEVLYGKGSGGLLAVAVVKEAILRLGSCLAAGVGDGAGGSSGEGGSGVWGTGADGSIFLSQVAAAIAALHERLSLEKKIRALRAPRPSKHQLYAFFKLCVLYSIQHCLLHDTGKDQIHMLMQMLQIMLFTVKQTMMLNQCF
jgi:U11/U12 small nuclear ribonucleoprotein SNRNP48